SSAVPPERPAFPTRRSSDLDAPAGAGASPVRIGFGSVADAGLGEFGGLGFQALDGVEGELERPALLIGFGVDHDDLAGPELLVRSEEHTSELQSRFDLVCRL